MKWWPRPLEKGDMIRVRVGSVYHYGIFVSEDEVIQFGPPPAVQFLQNSADFCVMAGDIDTFCGGVIVEAACPETKEERKRFSPGKTVKLARASIGERGYDIIHNNCEHFAYGCVYGVKRSAQADEARRRWHSRPILNVYVLPIDREMSTESVYPRERAREILDASGNLRIQKLAAWRALEMGLSHAFGARIRDLTFKKDRHGKWSCDQYAFSITHTETAVAVALSNGPVGVDMERVADFSTRHTEALPSLCRQMLAKDEQPPETSGDFLTMWTRKESIFKCRENGRFHPELISAAADDVRTIRFDLDGEMILSVCGARIEQVCYYQLSNPSANDPNIPRPCRLRTDECGGLHS